jgi:hypothetical protein
LTGSLVAQSAVVLQLPLHLPVKLVFVIVVVGQRRMDLSQRKMRVRCVDFLGVPAISGVVHRDLDDLGVRVCNLGDSTLVTPNVSDWFDH